MSVAHQETVGMAIFTALFLLVFVLAVLYQRRTGTRHGWFFPSLLLVVVGVVLMVVTWSGFFMIGG